MDIPQELTPAIAAHLSLPSDTQAMRVLVRGVANQNDYTLRGKRRRYILSYCPRMACHFIDIPMSLWSDGINPERQYEENQSVAHDIQHNSPHMESLVVFPVPYGNAEESPAADAPTAAAIAPPEVLDSLRSLAQRFGAPEIMLEAIDLVKRGLNAKATCLALDSTSPETLAPEPEAPSENAERMRKLREAKAAKKAAKLQPA